MSAQSSVQDITECPNCKTAIRLHGEGTDGPMFCLRCRFPLMLVAGKYRLLRIVNEGGFGVIYEAVHTRLTRDPKRAIKVIRPELVASEELQLRFAREVQVTSALSQMNGHIVRIYDDFGEIPNFGHFYVMEYLEGHSLAKMFKDAHGLLPLELCYHLFRQLCDAMHAAHSEGVIHRDLKPENLLVISRLRDSHYLKVIDFGIARPVEGSGEITNLTQGILGTPAYMSPEQCMSKGVDERSDIYAMGIILFELLAGRTPFGTSTEGGKARVAMMELITAHLMQDIPSLIKSLPPGREVPASLEAVVTKAIAKSPEARYNNVLELEADFCRALGLPQQSDSEYATPSTFSLHPSVEEDAGYPVLNEHGRPTGPGRSAIHTPPKANRSAHHTPPPAQIQYGVYQERMNTSTPLPPQPSTSLPTGINLSFGPAETPTPVARGEEKPQGVVSDTAPQTPFAPVSQGIQPTTLQDVPIPRRSWLLWIFVVLMLSGTSTGGWWLWQRYVQTPSTDPYVENSQHDQDQQVFPPPRPSTRKTSPLPQRMGATSPLLRRTHSGSREPSIPLQRPGFPPIRTFPVERIHTPPPVIRRRTDDAVVRYIAPRRSKVIKRRIPPTRRTDAQDEPENRSVQRIPSMCPNKSGYRWIYVSLPTQQKDSVSFTFQGGSGIQEQRSGGFCLGTAVRSVRVQIRGLRENYVPCTLVLWNQRPQLRIKLLKDDGIVPESISYCVE